MSEAAGVLPAAATAATAGAYRERHFRSQNGLRLYYREYGGDDARRTPVLCLAGLTRNSKDFQDVALRLAPQRRVLALDYRGRGMSEHDPDWRNYRPEAYIGDVLDLLSVADIHRVIVLGTSMGGLLAMGLGAFRPTCLAGVVLNDVGPEVEADGYRRILAYISTDRPQPDLDSAVADVKRMFPNLSLRTEEQWRRMVDASYRRGADGLLHFDWDVALARTLGASQARFPDLWPLFRSLGRVPVLALRGSRSDVLSQAVFDRMAAEMPGLRRVVVPDVGHVPSLDEKEAVNALDEFFSRI